ncbi:Indigoidine synthase A like protein-domain-containing protein [Massariosphaeria phaeospora]|uniref:Indigoidine synthase A like protein-domain-containing protein n=1 Tax=Massariosphaeria phaeospora TaxID=100035 RepID=A0A7C8IKT8_9PLEO|nr:Indigoidine synthase A like protein-domain-containing protein [Massariosphaeria phaeospora]
MRLVTRIIGRPRLAPRGTLQPFVAGRRFLANNGFFRVSEEVREALNANKPIVALETTIYTHGFPYPDNVALASLLESIVRVNGGVPATIGILDGIARVGMDPEELIRLTESAGKKNTLKLSRRDLSYVCGLRLTGKHLNGGTTIAGTMLLAQLAGIKIFGTGGLGGVHRGAESSMDISADLTELGRTPVTVISSGCKSFLDIPRTLEYLETEGVGVGTFADGRSGDVDFPAFWSRDSGVKSPTTITDEIEAAAIIHAQNSLQISSGLLFANPCPVEAAIPKDTMDSIIEEAIQQADASGASGKDNTPFILNKIKELSNGESIPANRKLIESNVRRATIVARELSVLESKQAGAQGRDSTYPSPTQSSSSQLEERLSIPSASPSKPSSSYSVIESTPEIIVAGALAVDFSCDYAPLSGSPNQTDPLPHTSNPAVISQTLGGVAHNIAKAAHLVGPSVRLCSAIGDDLSGRAALSQLESEGMQTDGIKVLTPHRTAQYVAVNDANKDLVLAMADMSILETSTPSSITQTWLNPISSSTHAPRCLIVDANWTPHCISTWLEYGKIKDALTIFEPVSTAKSTRVFPSQSAEITFPNHRADIITPNTHELQALHNHADQQELFHHPDWFRVIDGLGIPSSGLRVPLSMTTSPELVDQGIPQQAIKLLPFFPTVLTKLGPQGVLLTQLIKVDDPLLSSPEESQYVLARCKNSDDKIGGLYVRLFPTERVLRPEEVFSVNGVGDTFLGALAAGLVRGNKVQDVVGFAQKAAALSLKSKQSVSPELAGLKGQIGGL